MAEREYIFFGTGILMFISGVTNLLLNPAFDFETIIIAPVGLFIIGFTYVYMRRDAVLAIENFDKRIKELKEQHNSAV